jgi:hypothetical protein
MKKLCDEFGRAVEARRIAANVAKLQKLLCKALRCLPTTPYAKKAVNR